MLTHMVQTHQSMGQLRGGKQMRKKVLERVDPFKGYLRFHNVPFESEAEFKYWWLPERDREGRVIREPRMSKQEKERYFDRIFENTLTSGGRSVVLSQMGSPSSPPLFAAYFSVGSGFVAATSALDTAVVTEYFRKAPSGFTVSGSQVDISIFLGTSEGNGTITNAGFYGGAGVTSTLGTGVLCTHTLFNYVKGSISVTVDYVLVQN